MSVGVYIKGVEMPKEGYIDVRIKCNGIASFAIADNPYFKAVEAVPVQPHGRLIDIDAPYQIQVHVDGLTKKGSVDIYAPAVLEADPAEEGE